jgi:hypothetical protein
VAEHVQELEDLLQRLADYRENRHELNTSLQQWEDKMSAHAKHGSAARDPKFMDKLKVWAADKLGREHFWYFPQFTPKFPRPRSWDFLNPKFLLTRTGTF